MVNVPVRKNIYVKCNGKPKQKQAYSYLNVKSEKLKQNKNRTNISMIMGR